MPFSWLPRSGAKAGSRSDRFQTSQRAQTTPVQSRKPSARQRGKVTLQWLQSLTLKLRWTSWEPSKVKSKHLDHPLVAGYRIGHKICLLHVSWWNTAQTTNSMCMSNTFSTKLFPVILGRSYHTGVYSGIRVFLKKKTKAVPCSRLSWPIYRHELGKSGSIAQPILHRPWLQNNNSAVVVSVIFWLNFCTIERSGDESSIFSIYFNGNIHCFCNDYIFWAPLTSLRNIFLDWTAWRGETGAKETSQTSGERKRWCTKISYCVPLPLFFFP